MTTRWVLLRGLARETGHWGAFPDVLRETLGAGHQVFTLDLPGNGRWHDQSSPASVSGLAAACRTRLAEMQVQLPVRVVAVSLGAMVALEWARTAPHELEACAVVNTSLRGFSPFWHRLRPSNYARLLSLLRPGLPALARERQVLAMTSHAAPEAVAEEWARIAAHHPLRARNVLRQLWAAARFRAMSQPPALPVLVLCSAGDRLVHPACSRALAGRWALPLCGHPWAGHDLALDDPGWLAAQLSQWEPSSRS